MVILSYLVAALPTPALGVAWSSLILRSVFGGESGISTDRTALQHMFGWTFGPRTFLPDLETTLARFGEEIIRPYASA